MLILRINLSGFSSVGRASASQAEGGGFETRNPLQYIFLIVILRRLFEDVRYKAIL